MAAIGLLVGGLALAQEPAAAEPQGESEAEQPAATGSEPSEEMRVQEVMVVTASRTEQPVQEAPAAITVISAAEIENAPADDYGDLLRNVPGLNVSQISARDIQVSARSATNSLATTQLVLVDNRSLYLDFFGFVMWDFLPVNTREIKQIEVVRGPGSAVWGANALTGVINLLTKSPREMQGTHIIVGGGELSTGYGSFTHAGVQGRLGYKFSAAYYTQDAYDRPTGLIPGTNTPYPPFENSGTSQPKFDIRLDWDQNEDTLWSISGGYAGTDGIIHSGIGPFDIDPGTNVSYVKLDYNRQALRATFFGNFLTGDAENFLAVGIDGRRLTFGFESQTYNFDISNTTAVGEHNVFTYGFNARHNNYDLSIAPEGDDRNEYGFFIQDEILLGRKFRWVIGGRYDNINPIDSVFSPRTSLLFSPDKNHTFRVSFNRAFRAPSVVENFLSVVILNQITLPTGPFVFPILARGNPELTEEKLTAYEVGYVGVYDRATVTFSVYRNELDGDTDFYPAAFYSAANPPPRWPLPPQFVPPNTLPSVFSYRNIGEITNKGFELGLDVAATAEWGFFANYSYQDDPEVKGTNPDEIGLPPNHRFNAGVSFDGPIFFANANVNYQDEAFWTDVLDERFWGPTDSFAMFNLTAGVKLAEDNVILSVICQNLFNEDVQQHVFGDLISRKVVGEARFHF